MDKILLESFNKWVADNSLPISSLDFPTFLIEGVGSFLIVSEKRVIENEATFEDEIFEVEEDGIVFNDKLELLLSKQELEFDVDFYVYEFGSNWYYTDKPKYPDLWQFKYLGKATQEIDWEFTPLGIRGQYELLNSNVNYTNACKKAKFLGYDSLGICEKNSLAGVLKFQLACEKFKIKPIFGEILSIKIDNNIFDLKFYVLDKIGWKNILQLNKFINIDNLNEDKYLTEGQIANYGKGLVVVLPNNYPISNYHFYEKYFEGVYYQIDTVIWSNEDTDLNYLKNIKVYLNSSINLEPILINDVFYLDKEEAKVKKILNKIGAIGHQNDSKTQYFKSLDENFQVWGELFKDEDTEMCFEIFHRAVSNTKLLTESTEFKIQLGKFHLPQFKQDHLEFKEETTEKLFLTLLWKRMEVLNLMENEVYLERIAKEIEVIREGGFIDYFLILYDIIRWCDEQKIIVGLGRGSAVGSLAAYLLGIVKVDPIKYDLLFERFLNKGRLSSLPDIDSDFEGERREDVVNYIKERYGDNFVCSIGTHTTFKIKQGLKDLARIKGIDFKLINFLTKEIYIKEGRDGDFEELFFVAQTNSTVKAFIQKNPTLIEDLFLIINRPKSASIHPCATIILPQLNNGEDIYSYLPLRKEGDTLVCEWEGPQLEAAGYLKEDILSLFQLDKFRFVLDLIKSTCNDEIDIYNIPTDDLKVMEYFKNGWTQDVFQFGSDGLQSYCKEVKPDSIIDLINMVALYRPGPIGSGAHYSYVNLKHGFRQPEYDFGLEEITKETFGLIIYQEQVMKACQVLGGFSLEETDEVRRAMGKKKESVLLAYKSQFIKGAISKGCPEEEASKIWDKLIIFSAYGFNKSHATAYSLMGYNSQWLKVHYPLQFWTTAFQFATKEEDVLAFMSEMKVVNPEIKIVPPDINKSSKSFKTDFKGNKIYWSLEKVKFLGDIGIEAILEEKEANGDFFSLRDFLERIPKAKANKRIVTNLILSGAFDEIEHINKEIERVKVLKDFYNFINFNEEKCPFLANSSANEEWFWILKQKEISGLGDFNFKSILNKSLFSHLVSKFMEGQELQNPDNIKKQVVCGGIIKEIAIRTSKNGPWCHVILDSNFFEINLFIWNPQYIKLKETLDVIVANHISKEFINPILLFSGIIKEDIQKGTNTIHLSDNDKLMIL